MIREYCSDLGFSRQILVTAVEAESGDHHDCVLIDNILREPFIVLFYFRQSFAKLIRRLRAASPTETISWGASQLKQEKSSYQRYRVVWATKGAALNLR